MNPTQSEIPVNANRDSGGVEHRAVDFILRIDIQNGKTEMIPIREGLNHIGYDVYWFGEQPWFFQTDIIDHDPVEKTVSFEVSIKNPEGIPVYDPRLIIYCEPGIHSLNPDAYTDYHPKGDNPINPFYAFAKDYDKRRLEPGEGDSRVIVIEYNSPTHLIELPLCLDVCTGGNTKEPYALGNIIQRGRAIYTDVLDRQDDAVDVRVTPADESTAGILLNRINDEVTWSATLCFPDENPIRLLISAGSEGTEHRIYNFADWDPSLMPLGFGRGIYAWTFYNPDTGEYPISLDGVVNKCKNHFGSSWLIANMGQVCYDGSLIYTENDFILLKALKKQNPDFPVFLNLGHLGFGPDDYDLCGVQFNGDFRGFFAALEIRLGKACRKYDLTDSADGLSFDFEIPMADFTLSQRAEFLDAYGDFIARLRRSPIFQGLYFCAYLDALMPKMLEYDYDALNHCKQSDFFFAAAFPASYVWDQDWWLHPGKIPQYWEIPSAFDYLVGMLDVYADIAETASSMFHPVLDTQGGWLDYKFDTLPLVQPCPWEGVANISDWCFAHPFSFGTSDELIIAKSRWRHRKLIERVIVDIPETDVDVLGKIGAVFIVLGNLNPYSIGDDIIFARAPFGLQGLMDVIESYDDINKLDTVFFHWEVAHDWKVHGILHKSPTGLGAVSGRVLFEDGSTFHKHTDEFEAAYIEVYGLPEGLPDYFYGTDIIGLDDGSYVMGGVPADCTVTLQAFAGSFASDPVEVEIEYGIHTRGIDLILYTG